MLASRVQPLLYPDDLFTDVPPDEGRPWICVHTKARCEKRLCAWLQSCQVPHYLPTVHRRQACGRTRYEVDLPLFSGYVFVLGDQDKGAFKDAGCVTEILRPRPRCGARLERDLWTIWRGLMTGSHLELARKLRPGDIVELKAPPFAGMQGRFESWGRHGRLHVWIDLMGCGVVIELSETDVALAV